MVNDVNKDQLDVMLILPPQWTPLSPYYGLPILAGELLQAGYTCKIRDLNVEFFNRMTSPEYLAWCRIGANNRLCAERDSFIHAIADYGVDAFNAEAGTLYPEIQGKIDKYELVWDMVVKNISKAKEIFRHEETFYDPEKVQWAFNIICQALEIASLPFYPSRFMMRDFRNPHHKFTIDSVMEATTDELENPFIDFYRVVIPTIMYENPKLIGISINSYSQVVAGLTLARMLKEALPETHISIGGNFFTRVIESFTKKPEFFDHFANSLTYEEGEIPMIKLAEFVNGKADLSDVPNLIYKKEDKVIINPKCKPKKLNDIAIPEFPGLDLDGYLTPEIVLPMQASRGCYWKKCTFCDHDYGVQYNVKTPQKLVEEMSTLKEKYGIKQFEFIDESISPGYLRKMSEAIIENELDVQWFMYARTEKGFTQELMDLAFKAGCRMIMWGVESGSKRIMELINKGIDIDNRFVPLENANQVGIWNFCFIFFGFPTETPEEALSTINMVMDHKDVINSYGMSTFTLGKHTKIREEPEKYGITNVREDEEELSIKLHYDITDGMTEKQVKTVCELCNAVADKIYFSPLWFSIGFREFLHLYLERYGLEYVKQYSYIAINDEDVKKKPRQVADEVNIRSD